MKTLTYGILLGSLLALAGVAAHKKICILKRKMQRAKADRKVHQTMPREMHCPTCWRTRADLVEENKLKTTDGYSQCGYHFADLDYGELPPEDCLENQEKIRRAFQAGLSEKLAQTHS